MTAKSPRPFPALPSVIERIHIIGICGTAMGSLAAMLKESGFDVRGSDAMAYPPMSDWLKERGIGIMLGYDKHNLDWNPDLVIVGNVVRSSYADAVAMRDQNIPFLSLPEALRYFFMNSGHNLVITGTHGKTTTTSMLAWVLHYAKHDSGFMVGGITGNFGSNYAIGHGKSFVIEGDEYDTAYFDKVPKFWHYAPFRATINNIEYDHADIYPDISSIEHVFSSFAKLIPKEGSLWINGDDTRAVRISQNAQCPVKTFGLGPHNTLRASHITMDEHTTHAHVFFKDKDFGIFTLQPPGTFNIRNMLGALGIALEEGIDLETCRQAFALFKTTRKRQELIAKVAHIKIYDDFAHHPTAVGVTIEAMRARYPERTIWAVFEAKSNTSRRRVFQDQYPTAFAKADHVILSKPWRKDDGISTDALLDIDQLCADITALGPHTRLIPDVDDLVAQLSKEVAKGDIVVGLSGSSFGGFHRKLCDALKARFPRHT